MRKALAAEAHRRVNTLSSRPRDGVVAEITRNGGKGRRGRGECPRQATPQGISMRHSQLCRLDILVNNSGVYEFAPSRNSGRAIHRQFNTNVLGLLLTTRAAVKHLSEGASIINIGSAVTR